MALGWALLVNIAVWACLCKERHLMVVCISVSRACHLCKVEHVPEHAAEGL